MDTRGLLLRIKQLGNKVTTHLHLVLSLRMCELYLHYSTFSSLVHR
jgi:hypothetical protein